MVVPDSDRFVLHLDVDCFYCQVEELRNPSAYSGKPMGVTQKYLIVTSNYEARRRGVTKLMSIAEAKAKVPDLILVPGEDLNPYREASKKILAVASRFGPAEKLGLDETFLDLTPEVHRRLHSGHASASTPIVGHLYNARATALRPDTTHRTQDLRAVARPTGEGSPPPDPSLSLQPWWPGLALATKIAAEIREAIRLETGFQCSGGIGCNKLIAKLVSGMHKPNDQTCCPPSEAYALVGDLPVKALPGVGYKADHVLSSLQIRHVRDLRTWTPTRLAEHVGDKVAALCCEMCLGKDSSPVIPKGPPKSVTVEDSFKSAETYAAAQTVLRVLAPDLVRRLDDDFFEYQRTATQLNVKYRVKGQGWARTSLTVHMPAKAVDRRQPLEARAEAIATAALRILQAEKTLQEPLGLTLLNLGATSFQDGAAGTVSIDQFFPSARGQGAASTSQAAAGPALSQGALHFSTALQQGSDTADPTAAQKAVLQRRSYGANLDPQLVMSKSAERALREGVQAPSGTHSQRPQRPSSAVVPAAPTVAPAVSPSTAARLPPQQLQQKAAGEEDDEEGGAFWRDLEDTTRAPAPSIRAPVAPRGPLSSSTHPPERRLVLHCDVDSFYVAVERLDNPALVGKPVAVTQFNSGGFVAVSYEARAAGVRCGDGVGDKGRAEIPHLVEMKAVSAAEARQRCPGLVVLPMRVERYRAVAQALFEVLKEAANAGHPVEKSSYDDFYLDATWAATGIADDASRPPATWPLTFAGAACVHVDAAWASLPDDLRRGVLLGVRVKQAVLRRFGPSFTISIGVARTKLLARIAGPLQKPDGLTVVPDGLGASVLRGLPLRSVPILGLRGKAGEELCAKLPSHVVTVGDLASVPDLRMRVGADWAAQLLEIYNGEDMRPVEERGPPKSLVSERSFAPMQSFAEVEPNLLLLAEQLLPRLREDQQLHGPRQPSKLTASYRIGYGGVKSKSGAFPCPIGQASAAVLAGAAMSLLKAALAPATTSLNLTRLIITVGFPEGGGGATGSEKAIASFFARAPSNAPAAAAPAVGVGMGPEPPPPKSTASAQDTVAQAVSGAGWASPSAQCPPAPAPPTRGISTAVNDEIKALREVLKNAPAEDADEDLALALRLQQEELGLKKRPANAGAKDPRTAKKSKGTGAGPSKNSSGPPLGVRPLSEFFKKK